MRRHWFGTIDGLHIDWYKKIKNVDRYRVNVKILKKEIKKINLNKITIKNLWDIKIGGYDPSSMQDKHEFGLVVTDSSMEPK